jgi:mono/diheme cytochrome c family protein
VFKRTWIILMITLALVAILSACGGGDLAEELTPIPTLPPGSEPELVTALRGEAAPQAATAEPTAEAGGEMSQEELVALGEQLFASACSACHGEQDGAGPAFTDMGEKAATRVGGMSAEAYLHESIVDPGAYVVEGFNNIMPKGFGDQYSETELAGMVAYIIAESGGEAAVQAGPTEEAAPVPEGTAEAAEAPAGDPVAGEALFATNCSACHGEEDGAGPARTGMGERAAIGVEGLSAEEYLHQAIVDPGAHIVEGFSNIMPKAYGDQLTEQELSDLIAYLLTQ